MRFIFMVLVDSAATISHTTPHDSMTGVLCNRACGRRKASLIRFAASSAVVHASWPWGPDSLVLIGWLISFQLPLCVGPATFDQSKVWVLLNGGLECLIHDHSARGLELLVSVSSTRQRESTA